MTAAGEDDAVIGAAVVPNCCCPGKIAADGELVAAPVEEVDDEADHARMKKSCAFRVRYAAPEIVLSQTGVDAVAAGFDHDDDYH